MMRHNGGYRTPARQAFIQIADFDMEVVRKTDGGGRCRRARACDWREF
jgi:hypothetical protein